MGKKTENSIVYICANCGAVAIVHTYACPQCGADSKTGWNKSARYKLQKAGSKKYAINFSAFFRYFANWKSAAAVTTAIAFIALILPWNIFPVFLILCVMIFALVLYLVLPQTKQKRQKQLYLQLLKKARGDRQLTERLIEIEKKNSPDAGQQEWLKAAIYRWEREFK